VHHDRGRRGAEGEYDRVAERAQEEVVAAKVTAEFDAKVTGATPQTADRFVTQLYQEIKAAR